MKSPHEETQTESALAVEVHQLVMPSDIHVISMVENHDEKNIRKGDMPPHMIHLYDGDMEDVVESRIYNRSITMEFYAPRGMFELSDKFEYNGGVYALTEKTHNSMGTTYKAISFSA